MLYYIRSYRGNNPYLSQRNSAFSDWRSDGLKLTIEDAFSIIKKHPEDNLFLQPCLYKLNSK